MFNKPINPFSKQPDPSPPAARDPLSPAHAPQAYPDHGTDSKPIATQRSWPVGPMAGPQARSSRQQYRQPRHRKRRPWLPMPNPAAA
jgi:hypothetical protein